MLDVHGIRSAAIVLCLCGAHTVCGATQPRGEIRDAAQKAIALLQKTQKDWKQNCYSCHQQALPEVAFDAARRHGIAVDEEAAHAAAAKAFAVLADIDRSAQFTHIIDPAISESNLLIGAHAAGVRPGINTALYARMIASRQKADGHWDTLDERPPQSYSGVTATATALHAVQLYRHPNQAADARERIARARAWLAAVRPRDTEERTSQLLGLFWAGAPKADIAPLAATLIAEQQDDGGWREIATRPSDAYSTGEVLAALHEAAGVPATDAAWRRGIAFLLRTQAADGSWHVVSRLQPPAPVSPPYFETGYPYGHDQFVSAMGASWAVRALSDALEDTGARTPELREAAPSSVEPWMETVAFGSLSDLRKLLDSGFDPNSATKTGGTTALMLALPDLEKAKLLVARGADVNARARTKYSALMVAAQYSGSAPVMNWLLDRGATVELPKGGGAPLFNASPLVLAAAAGNAEIVPRLVKSGARPDAPMLMLGTFPTSAFQIAVFFGDTTTARILLDKGASLDLPDDDGITPLGWAAIANLGRMAKMLVERGADVNHVDKKGMTPLLYAASVAYGDSYVVELLLKAGANPKARTRDGLTAADLVRRYRHVHLYAAVGQ